MRIQSFIFFGVVLGLIAGLLFSTYRRYSYGEVFSDSDFARLKPGMTTNDVMAILGPPSGTSSGHWEYNRFLMYNVGLVFFDETGLFTKAIND